VIKEKMDILSRYTNLRYGSFLLSCLIAVAGVYEPLRHLIFSSSHGGYYSHIIMIPFVSSFLLYLSRKMILSDQRYAVKQGIPIMLIGVTVYLLGRSAGVQLNDNDYASVITLAAVIFINGAFLCLYGIEVFKKFNFPLIFLIFTIPIPSVLMNNIIYFLQVGSTEFTNLLLFVSGVPFLREGFVFHLPGQSIEVAPQCSGIRSGLALFITALLAGHLFLKTWWKKVFLVVCAIPIAMFKNGIRITSLTLLGTYVDPRILGSSLHRDGGIPFFIVALLLMAPILFSLRKSEKTLGQGSREIQ
jgi:exosortase